MSLVTVITTVSTNENSCESRVIFERVNLAGGPKVNYTFICPPTNDEEGAGKISHSKTFDILGLALSLSLSTKQEIFTSAKLFTC